MRNQATDGRCCYHKAAEFAINLSRHGCDHEKQQDGSEWCGLLLIRVDHVALHSRIAAS